MSFKGFGRAITRAPQSFRQKFNMGEQTEDPVYEDAERRFKELEDETKKLSDESKRYSTAVNGMLNHQIGFAKAMEEIFKPISGKMSDPNATIPEDNPDGIEASEQYRAVVAELQETLKPDLTLIEDKVVKPCQELLKVITYIRKMATKRNHKKLDLDRRLNTYSKYENKKEPTAKDEERMYKAQAEMEVAQQEYDYYNEMMKTQLPILFSLEAQFVQPLFVSFYYMQLNIFYTLYNRFQEMKIPYFDLDSDIVEAFTIKRGNVEEQADSLAITHFKVGYSKAKLEMTRKKYGADSTPPPSAPAYGVGADGASPGATPGYGAQVPAVTPYGAGAAAAAPGYGADPAAAVVTPGYGAAAVTPGYGAQVPAVTPYGAAAAAPAVAAQGYDVKSSVPPAQPVQAPGPPAYSAAPQAETCTSLYEYQAQAAGDLSFPAGVLIEIVERTANVNEWWTGRYNGQQGVFPGNYVQMNQ
ncbi:hypothetical protein Kpol_440p10 [Vanderwaltozyma polyspora DSM 70294]|uniref:SH3 domain-containing protein n=1 Tax=Vanderwaltozyma polyspora (strain ATCC 22028 / DSM 70294 / BCRC 21397 / CBS 2163 / NBRC 10782 / NRRL Y-8283 / UCD 57-17) TaxID=436907 RepID=A7TRE9_VANPO|nr:uncharacterized protein Kpol_440p10 [Vanderwaltozyma polyspora DSM 70294]EDO15163.1 hypothetical protein Kpol_440p10 [Vanderwaltozyma polyspora DSM 70294]